MWLLLSHFLVFELHTERQSQGQRQRAEGQRQRPIKAVGEWHINEHITHYLQPEKICKIVGVVAEAAIGSLESRRLELSRVRSRSRSRSCKSLTSLLGQNLLDQAPRTYFARDLISPAQNTELGGAPLWWLPLPHASCLMPLHLGMGFGLG